MSDPRRTAAVLLILAATCSQISPLWSSTLGVLEGRVVDAAGEPLPGVTVTARSSSSAMAESGTVTDADGRYRLPALPAADDYIVRAELPGYARVDAGPVVLDPGRTTRINLSLVPTSETTEKITVVGRGDLLDLATTKTATVFNAEFIEGLPIFGRSYQDLLTLAPGVTDIDGDGNPNVNGGRETDFQTRLDGANISDPFSGTFGQNLNLESIAELEVITTGAGAEFGQAQGGFANALSKSGGNQFEGSFKFFFRSDLFDNDGANNNDLTDSNLFAGSTFTDIRPFLTLGGPILHDRLWYFVALEYIATDRPVNTLTTSAVQTVRGWNNFGKLTWQPRPAHRLSLQASFDPARFTGNGLGTGVAPESDYIVDQGGSNAIVRWTYNISPSVLIETMAARLDTYVDLLPATDSQPCLTDQRGRCDPFVADIYTFDDRSGTIRGPYFQTARDHRVRDSLRSDLSWFKDGLAGTHHMKYGFETSLESYERDQTVDTIRHDTFTGSSFAGGLTGSINFEEAFPANQTLRADRRNDGFYVHDSWKPRPNISLNVGLRMDREEVTSVGYTPFDPMQEAQDFLQLYSLASGQPLEELTLFTAFLEGNVLYDVNDDGLDPLHCMLYDLDGDALGDGSPNGESDDFWTYFDGDFDGIVDCANPFDVCIQAPDGLSDGQSTNPLCDRLSDDAFTLLEVFSRHQFDDSAHPFDSVVNVAPWRGLPGEERTEETFTITNTNLAPRLNVSWDPFGNNRTKLFVNWSRFYNKIFLAAIVPELGPDARTTVYSADSVSLGADAVPLQTGRFQVTQVDRDLKTPFADEFTIGFDRELAPEWSISLMYVHKISRDQLQDVDMNHYVQDLNADGILDDNFGRVGEVGNPGDDVIGGDGPNISGFAVAPDGQPDLFAFNPFFNQVMHVGNHNSSRHESLQFRLTRRMSRRWQMTGSYVYSTTVGDAEEFISPLGNDLGYVEDEYGPLNYDIRHRLVASGTTLLPGNQTIGGTVEWASGLPYSLILQQESADSFGSFSNRTTYPTGQRNDQRNESTWLLNLLYRKGFTFGRVNASVAVEIENVLNSDDLRIETVDQGEFLGIEGGRRFGRRWQLSAQFHF